jgi:Zn-dependent protease with chaperone function
MEHDASAAHAPAFAASPAALPHVDERCPLCDKSVVPDALGLVECSCSWGGPGDPIASAHGLSRLATRIDRRLANRMGQADLRRVARGASLGAGYLVVLIVVSTVVYLVIGALLLGSVALAVAYALQGVWFGAGVCAVVALITFFSLFEGRPKLRGVEAPRARFPALAAALDKVSRRVGAPAPHRVILVPEAQAFVFQHRPLRRLFRRELVLGLGAGALPLLSDLDLKAILAHELAHYRHGHTAVHLFVWRAEQALGNFISVLMDAFRVQRGPSRRVRSGQFVTLLAAFFVMLVTLPISLLLVVFHLLRLAESRSAEFEADRTAMRAYGPQAFLDGLTGLLVADHTMRRARQALYAEMRKHQSANFYAQMRRHYSELPAPVIAKLRLDAVRDFRSLERTHPTTSDRLRAAYLIGAHTSSPADLTGPARPAVELLVPAGASSTDAVESELTALLFGGGASSRRRR